MVHCVYGEGGLLPQAKHPGVRGGRLLFRWGREMARTGRAGDNWQLRCTGCFLSAQHCAEYPGPVILFHPLFNLMTWVPVSPPSRKKETKAGGGKVTCLRLHRCEWQEPRSVGIQSLYAELLNTSGLPPPLKNALEFLTARSILSGRKFYNLKLSLPVYPTNSFSSFRTCLHGISYHTHPQPLSSPQ